MMLMMMMMMMIIIIIIIRRRRIRMIMYKMTDKCYQWNKSSFFGVLLKFVSVSGRLAAN